MLLSILSIKRASRSMLRQVYSLSVFEVLFDSLGSSWALLGSLGDALGLLGIILSVFSCPRCPKVMILGSFLMTFRGSGAHVKTVLSRESQHDPEGSGGSENRWFLDVFLDAKKRVFERVLL